MSSTVTEPLTDLSSATVMVLFPDAFVVTGGFSWSPDSVAVALLSPMPIFWPILSIVEQPALKNATMAAAVAKDSRTFFCRTFIFILLMVEITKPLDAWHVMQMV